MSPLLCICSPGSRVLGMGNRFLGLASMALVGVPILSASGASHVPPYV
jgi:hypothetical protein